MGYRFRLCFTALVVSFGCSFQIGYYSVMYNVPQDIVEGFVNDSFNRIWNTTLEHSDLTWIWSSIVSLNLLGKMISCFFVPFFADRFGRKWSVVLWSVPALISVVLQYAAYPADDYNCLAAGRFLNGLSGGFAGVLAPLFFAEIAGTPKWRSALSRVHIVVTVFGSVTAFLLGLPEILGTREYWAYLPVLPAIFVIFTACYLPFVPESPLHLICKNRSEDEILESLRFYTDGDQQQTKALIRDIDNRRASSATTATVVTIDNHSPKRGHSSPVNRAKLAEENEKLEKLLNGDKPNTGSDEAAPSFVATETKKEVTIHDSEKGATNASDQQVSRKSIAFLRLLCEKDGRQKALLWLSLASVSAFAGGTLAQNYSTAMMSGFHGFSAFAKYATVVTSVVKLAIVIGVMHAIDRLGRRRLLLICCYVTLACYASLIVLAMFTGSIGEQWALYIRLPLLLIWTGASYGVFSTASLIVAETASQSLRATGLALYKIGFYFGSVVITVSYPHFAELSEEYGYLLVACPFLVALIYVTAACPETKNVNLLRIDSCINGEEKK